MEKYQKLGQTIKFFRQMKSMSQDALAVGICTSSYLSRIENGLVEAEEVVYIMLFERLQLDYKKYLAEDNLQEKFIEEIYESLLSNEQVSNEDLLRLEKLVTTISYPSIQLIIELVYCRYLLSKNRNDEASVMLETIEPLVKPSMTREWQLFVAVKTYYELSMLRFDRIINRELQTNSVFYFSTTSMFEKANYLYHLAFACHRAYQFASAKNYIDKAIQAFKYVYKPLFQVKLSSMNGVILNSLGQTEQALKEYGSAIDWMRHVPSISTEEQWASIYNNMAFAFESQKKYASAIEFYEKSLVAKSDRHTMINYLRTLLFSNEKEKTLIVLEKLAEEVFNQKTHHYHQLQLIRAFTELDENSIEAFLKVEKVALKHFVEENHLELILSYGPFIATICEEVKQYKRATEIYRLLFETSEKIRFRVTGGVEE